MLGRLGLSILVLVLALTSWLLLRPNQSKLDPALGLESWDIVADGEHNSNTDLIWWRDAFLLVHAASPYHLGTPRSRLLVKRSLDGRHFETLARLQVPGQDIRDPKLAVLRDGFLWTEYYTSRVDRDYPWLLGMFLPTDLRMARVPLGALVAVRAGRP